MTADDAKFEAKFRRFIGSTSPPVRFRIYARPGKSTSRIFFRVFVWQDRAVMFRFLREFRYQKKLDPKMLACCIEMASFHKTPGCPPSRKPVNGELHFHRGRYDAETTTHEVTHAAFAWARRIGLDIAQHANHDGRTVHPNEETFVESVGFMLAQLAYHSHRRKLWNVQ